MEKDKIKTLILEFVLILFLFFVLFAPNVITRRSLSIVMLIYMLVVYNLLKKRGNPSIYKNQVRIVMVCFALIYVAGFYLMGIYFEFVKAKYILSISTIAKYIIPLSILTISSEIVRSVFLAQKIKLNLRAHKINISLILTYIVMVLTDLVIYTDVYNLTNMDDFLAAIGFVLFASLSSNLFFNYTASRYGYMANIIFRLITILYVYIIPITPDVYIFFKSFLRMLYPYLMYLVLEKLFSKNDFTISYTDKKKQFIGNAIVIVIITLIIMLISCQFTYGILVVGSKSMTGSINMGDAIIFEKYDGQTISTGQVILFDYNGIQTIHRVVEIKKVNGQYRYYTKGDANKRNDKDYRTDEDIKGLAKLKIKYIGYPTLWFRELFS